MVCFVLKWCVPCVGIFSESVLPIFTKISLIFSYFSLKQFKNKLDPRKYNGAIFLGLNGPVVKSHGGTDSLGFYYSIDLCYRIVKGDLMKEIKNNLSHLSDE